MNVEAIPQELRDLDSWVVWRTEVRDGNPTKVPYAVTGRHARANDPRTWSSFEEALAVADEYDGIGFFFSTDDPYAGIDLDDCRDPETGEFHEAAREVIDALDSYAEVSPSKTGAKIIVRASKPGKKARTGKTPWDGDIEMYDERRYFAITGESIGRSEVRDAQDALDKVYAKYLGALSTGGSRNGSTKPNHERVDSMDSSPATSSRARAWESYCGTVQTVQTVQTDAAILRELLARPRIAALYDGTDNEYASNSERDFALVKALLILTRDREQIVRLWKSSALGRDKLDERRGDGTYATLTIESSDEALRSTGFASLGLQSDAGNADRLVAEHGDDLRYITGIGWCLWDGSRWKPDADAEVERRVSMTARRLYEAVPTIDYSGDKGRLARFALNSTSSRATEATMRAARSSRALRVPMEMVDRSAGRLNVLNGTLDLAERRLDPHNKSDYFTKRAPVEWDENAVCEEWESYLARVLPDEELRDFVQRLAGYSVAGKPSEKVLGFLHGTRDTGKSTFLNAVASTLGDYAATANFESFIVKRGGHGTRNDLARLRGVHLVKSLEVEEGSALAAGVLKSWSGGDAITARFLYREEFEFVPQGVLWLAANARPKVQADDDAMWRRILHVPFIESIPLDEQDTKLGDRLAIPEAKSAILRWLVDGYAAYLDRGLDVPKVVTDYTDEYRHENNDLAGWWDDGYSVIDKSEWSSWESIKKSIEAWSSASRARMPNDAAIRKALRAAGCNDRKSGGVRGWDGVKVLIDGDEWRS